MQILPVGRFFCKPSRLISNLQRAITPVSRIIRTSWVFKHFVCCYLQSQNVPRPHITLFPLVSLSLPLFFSVSTFILIRVFLSSYFAASSRQDQRRPRPEHWRSAARVARASAASSAAGTTRLLFPPICLLILFSALVNVRPPK